MVKVAQNTGKAGRNYQSQVKVTPRNDTAKATGNVVRGTDYKVKPTRCGFSHERGAGPGGE